MRIGGAHQLWALRLRPVREPAAEKISSIRPQAKSRNSRAMRLGAQQVHVVAEACLGVNGLARAAARGRSPRVEVKTADSPSTQLTRSSSQCEMP